MKRKGAAEIFSPVNPNLTVISARYGRHRGKKKAKILSELIAPPLQAMAVSEESPVSTRYAITEDDWGGVAPPLCPICQQETLQLINGICPRCGRKVKERTDQEVEMESLSRSLRQQRARNK